MSGNVDAQFESCAGLVIETWEQAVDFVAPVLAGIQCLSIAVAERVEQRADVAFALVDLPDHERRLTLPVSGLGKGLPPQPASVRRDGGSGAL